MHSTSFLQDLAVVMLVAAVVTVVFRRLKQPVVLGYILAGLIIGPHTPPYALIKDENTIHILAELGVILLMFALGLEFSLRKLKQVGAPALLAALLEILVMCWIGWEIGRMFGWSAMNSVFLGAILSISSTTIIIKTFSELGRAKESFAHLVFGILIIEDILGIAMIALLSGIAMTGSLSVMDLGRTLGKLGIFLAVILVAGLIFVPRLLGYVGKFKSNEMLLITSLGLCFGTSLLAEKLGYSVALGAFVIGAVIAESREIHRIEAVIAPVRDMFSAIFFVAIGLLFDPRVLLEHWFPILIITVAVLAGKIFSCSLGALAGGNDPKTSLRVGMSLAQIGEFSFIIAALGLSLKVTSDFLYPIAVAVSAITTLTTPYLIRSSDALGNAFDRHAPPSLVNYLHLYTEWVGRLGSQKPADPVTRALRRTLWQMVLNAILIAALFLSAAYLVHHPPAVLSQFELSAESLDSLLWLAATMFSLPMLLATFHKLQALGLLIAEMKVPEKAAGEKTSAIRAVVAQLVPGIGLVVIGVYIIALSSAIVPPKEILVALIAILAVLTWLFRRSFTRLYSKAQFALRDTLSQEPAPHPDHAPHGRTQVPPEVELESIVVTDGSPAAGKRIRELTLRTRTGASIVSVKRNGDMIVNPDPDEELQTGDQVWLIGSPTQIESALAALQAGQASGGV